MKYGGPSNSNELHDHGQALEKYTLVNCVDYAASFYVWWIRWFFFGTTPSPWNQRHRPAGHLDTNFWIAHMKLYFCPLWQWGPFCPRHLSPNVWKSHSCKGAGSPFHFVNIIYMITSFILIPFSSFTQLLFYITFSAVLYFIRRSSRKSVKTSNMQIHQGLISKYGMALNKKEFWMIWKEMRYAKFLTLTMIMHIWHWGWKIQQYCLKEYCCFGVIIHIACLIVLIIILINVLVKMLTSTRWWFRHSMSGWISLPKMRESSSLSLTSR